VPATTEVPLEHSSPIHPHLANKGIKNESKQPNNYTTSNHHSF
jgi:hypothetical protein